MDLGLAGKYALITGGTHGIGRATALALAGEGCHVAICSRTLERIDTTLGLLQETGVETLGIQADVMEKADLDAVCREIIRKWATIHILINNVGGGGRWGSEVVEETDERVWMEVYEKNVLTAIRLTRWAIPYMRAQQWGRVINITSIFGREGGGRPWFSMAKTAQTAMMKSLAMKHYLSSENITFNSIAPGAIMIPNTGWEKEAQEKPDVIEKLLKQEFPLERFGTPEEVANVIAFVCSEKASLLNGVSIAVDGSQSKSMI
ncbi:Oxidoreductase, short-chain dehydrogenase/reductase family [Olavius algarvensis Delta 1 endosymbiont]|nr:Oxidoreductase, short-chain dehydrogenase/reductase family [Olavius algarvensis Delta 1 endosymbiont]